ncbi:MAG: high-affinity branched-chain amino acid ABC transporter permease LivM [Bdellovibrionota bacterium]
MDRVTKPSLLDSLKKSLATGVLAFVVLSPITGIVLDGYNFDSHFERPLVLALTVMILRFILDQYGFLLKAKDVEKKDSALSLLEKLSFHTLKGKILIFSALFILMASIPFVLSKYWITVFILALIYVLLGLGLNIVVGLAGLLDLGFVAFYAVGAYGYALSYQYLGVGFWGAIPCAALTAACFGAVLGFPVLRMHGDYLAIVTLGFGEIIRLILNNWLEFTGGPNGVRAPVPTFMGLEFTRRAKQGGVPFHEYFNIEYSSSYKYMFIYLVLLVVVACVLYCGERLKKMPIGRAWEALREDEIACRSLGLNHVTVKLSAFSTGAMIGGIAGVFFAAYQGFVNPSSFTFFESALILAVVVLGGLGSSVGVVLAAVALTVLPEVLREFASYRVLIFGVLMVLMMIWKPRGLIKMARPRLIRSKG